MNYFTPTNLPCQLLNIEIRSNTWGFFINNLSYKFKLIFREYFSVCQNYEKVYVSHEKIAARVKCSVRTVGRAVIYFKEVGIMDYIYRHRNTSEYSMNEFFFTQETRKKLSNVFRFFMPFALSMLALGSDVRPLNINVKLESNNKPNTRERINYARVCERQDGYLIFDLDQENKNNYELKKGQFIANGESMLEAKEILKLNGLVDKFPLTMHGIVKLAVYPLEAIDYAESSLQTVLKARDPFQLFQHLCKQYCEQNRIAITWSKYYRFKETFAVDDKEPYMNEEMLRPLRINPTASKKVYGKKEDQKRESLCPKEEAEALKRASEPYTSKMKVSDAKRSGGETDFEFVENCERGIHKRKTVNDPKPLRWNLIPLEQYKKILQEQHPDCQCRDAVKREFGLVEAVDETKTNAKPLAQFMDKIISSRMPDRPQSNYDSEGNRAQPSVDVPIRTEDSPFDYLDESTGELIEDWE